MKAKRKIILIFNLLLVVLMMLTTQLSVFATATPGELSLGFVLTDENGKQVVMADPGDLITVSFAMERTDADEGFETNGFQNYIHYDLGFFELVEDSIVCYDTGNATAKRQTSITYGEIVQCQNMGNTYEGRFVFCTFSLRVIGESGAGMIMNDEAYAFDTNYRYATVEKHNMQVQIDTGCTHVNKTKVDAKPSACDDLGWDEHYACDDCDAVFDASGVWMIPGIPYREAAHSFAEELEHNGLGHWYQCTECGERSEYGAHSNGTATCVKKAVCGDCGQEYGSVDAHNHAGETTVEDEKDATYFTKGYTGDIYCSDCGELIESGQDIDVISIEFWPWWMWLIIAILVIAILGVIVHVLDII